MRPKKLRKTINTRTVKIILSSLLLVPEVNWEKHMLKCKFRPNLKKAMALYEFNLLQEQEQYLKLFNEGVFINHMLDLPYML